MKAIPELDGVRALAILAVLAIHGSYGNIKGGFLGVDLFFVLSGFLITTLLIAERASTGTVNLRFFYARRALRILPPLIVGILVAALLWEGPSLLRAIPPILLFYANLVDYRDLGVMTHTWSLSVEEHFYFVWPFLFLWMSRWDSRRQIVVVAALLLGAAALRVSMLAAGFDAEFVYRFTLTRMDSLLAGCLAALLFSLSPPGRVSSPWPLIVLFCCLCAAFVFATKESTLMITAGFTAFAVLCAVFIVAALRVGEAHPVRRILGSGPLRYIGRRSYGIYIYHLPIFIALEPLRLPHDLGNFVWVSGLRFAATLLVAELSYRTVESWALSYKSHFRP